MQTLYVVCTNQVGQVSVDVFSERHSGVSKWKCYFSVGPATVARLRRVYRAEPSRFYIRHEWSAGRWAAYKKWVMDGPRKGAVERVPSLVLLQTKGQA